MSRVICNNQFYKVLHLEFLQNQKIAELMLESLRYVLGYQNKF